MATTTMATTTIEDPATSVLDRMQTLTDEMDTAQKSMKNMQAERKKLQKDFAKCLKKKRTSVPQLDENGEKIVQKTGFALPVPLSLELCQFLALPEGTYLSRTDVTRRINAYIKEHSLQDPTNGRQINPDDKLQALLNPVNDDLSYFTLQKYMKHHFKKIEKEDTSAPKTPATKGDVHVDIVTTGSDTPILVGSTKGGKPVTKKASTPRKTAVKKAVAA